MKHDTFIGHVGSIGTSIKNLMAGKISIVVIVSPRGTYIYFTGSLYNEYHSTHFSFYISEKNHKKTKPAQSSDGKNISKNMKHQP